MEGQTIQEIFLNNINSKKESGITFIEGKNSTLYLSYKKLYLEASYKLHALQQKGLQPGDELVFQFQSNKSFVVTFWACVLGGFTPVPIVLGTTSDIVKKIAAVWSKLNNPFIITDVPQLKKLLQEFKSEHGTIIENVLSRFIYNDELVYAQKATPVPSKPSDLVFIQFSSGSTGVPKGVTNTQESIVYNVGVSLDKFSVTETDNFLGWMPLTHDMGLIFFHILPLLANANQFLMPPMTFLSRPEIWLESLSEQEITISGSPNFGYVHVLENIGRTKLEEFSFNKLRVLINSAEPVSIAVCKKFEAALEPYGLAKNTLNPAYGLAEAVLGVSAYYKEEIGLKEFSLDRGRLSIGDEVEFVQPDLDNTASFADLGSFLGTEIKIANENNEDLGQDRLGIIHLRSKAITSGYYNDPETSQKVISDEGWFNTGDIGFLHADHLVITGRQKEMIIINGQNYFPNDIDSLMEELPEINFQQAISCSVFNEEKHQDELYVFVQYSGTTEDFIVLADAIKTILSERVGIMSQKIVRVDKIPRTTSGKIQRYVLRDRYIRGEYKDFIGTEDTENTSTKETYVAPSSAIEKKLAGVWQEYFGIEQVGIEDNFFYLGGNSVGMGILASKIQDVFEVHLDVRELFARTNFKDQVTLIQNSLGKSNLKIQSAPIKSHYPLFGTQKRLFVVHQMDPESVAYNTPVVLQVDGILDIELCQGVFRKIIQRHEVLRTSFELLDGEPVQRIHDNVDFEVQSVECSDESVVELLKKYTKPFDLSNPPLVRVLLCMDKNVVSKIIMDIHHMVIDAASYDVLIEEFQSLYGKETLDPLQIQYRDFVEWEEKQQEEKQLSAQKEFWMQQYVDVPETLNMPFDYPKPNERSGEGDTVSFEVSTEVREKLRTACKENEVTMSTLTLSIFYVLLSKLTNQEDIIVGTSTLGRWQREFKDLIGLFINTLPLRSSANGNMEFSDFLNKVKTNVLACLVNEKYSFDQLLNDLELKLNANDNPLFNVTFEYHNFSWSEISLPGLHLSRVDHPNLLSKFDLVLRVVEKGNNYEFNLDYPTDLFDRETVERFASYYVRIIEAVLCDYDTPIKEITVLSEKDTAQLVCDFNDTTLPYEDHKTVLEIFSEKVVLKPEATAVVFEQECLSYSELDIKSTDWAKYLVQSNVKPGDKVALMMTRSIDVVTAMFAILKAGAAYLPVDVDLPDSRIKYMLQESNVQTVLTNGVERPTALEAYTCIDITGMSSSLKEELSSVALPLVKAENLMYVIFTSGSTGRPKGVMMAHKAIVNLVEGLKQRVYHAYGDRQLNIALIASHSFDASAQQIFGALLQGHSLYIANDETRKDGVKLRSFYNDNTIDVSDGTPTHLRFFVDALTADAQLESLSSWILAGEVLPKELVKSFYSKLEDGVQLYNFYGPTEACVDSTGYKVDVKSLDMYNSVPIGKPLPNERIYITDHYGKLVPVGTVGELCIAGDGLAEGYIGDTSLTAQKFSTTWISEEEKVYRTGDMAKWLPDGTIAYYGRNDDHVKIRGFRIHLSEIEAALNRLPEIQQSVAMIAESQANSQQLVGYIVCEKEMDTQKVQETLEKELPEYMVPRVYVQLPSFPMTSNGKIDKKLLKIPETNENYVAPTTKLEEQLAHLWQEVLGVEQVGIYDNFYELGGDSIKAIQLASRSKNAGIHFQVKDIFNHQTVSEIVLHLKTVNSTIQEIGILQGEVPLHPIQKHFFERNYKAVNHYNQAMLLKVSKSISEETLNFAISELAKQHDALRMHYHRDTRSKYPVQKYNTSTPKLVVEEIAVLKNMQEACTKHQSDLDIFKGDLTRFVLFKTPSNETENRLLMAIHHLVVDGVSFRVLTEDLMNTIAGHQSGTKITLPTKGTSYRQWNEKLRQYAMTDTLQKEHMYWKKIISNYSPLPTDISYDKQIAYGETENVRVSLPPSLTHTLLHEVNNTYGTEINDILISALTIALSEWVTIPKVVIGLEGHGREEIFKDVDINRTVGWFTSVYPVCLNVENVDDIGILIADTKDMLRGVPNKGMGYGLLRFESNSETITLNLSQFYEDLIFNYLGSFDNSLSSAQEHLGSLSSEPTGATIGRKNINLHKITMDCIIVDGSLYVDINYDGKRYHNTTIQKLANAYITALENILSHHNECMEIEEGGVENEDFEVFSL